MLKPVRGWAPLQYCPRPFKLQNKSFIGFSDLYLKIIVIAVSLPILSKFIPVMKKSTISGNCKVETSRVTLSTGLSEFPKIEQ